MVVWAGLALSLAAAAPRDAGVGDAGARDAGAVVDAGAASSSRAAAGTCSFEGTVSLLARDGKPLTISKLTPVLAYVDTVKDSKDPTPPPLVIIQKDRRFDPAVAVILRNQKIEFKNRDNELHDVFSKKKVNSFPPQASAGETTRDTPYQNAGHMRVQCDIHGFMRADVMVVKNRFYELIERPDGRYAISGLPPGDYTLKFWEPNGAVKQQRLTCEGTTKVPPVELTQDETEVLTHHSGQPYTGEYSWRPQPDH